jgi:hypothetical protein
MAKPILCWFTTRFKMRGPQSKIPEQTGWYHAGSPNHLLYGPRKLLDVSAAMDGTMYSYKRTLPEWKAEQLPRSLKDSHPFENEYDLRGYHIAVTVTLPVAVDPALIPVMTKNEFDRLVSLAADVVLEKNPGTKRWIRPKDKN